MLETLPSPIWVNSTELLQQMLHDLAVQDRVAVDTESNSLHAYREQGCLLQFSSSRVDYLFDLRDVLEKELIERDRLQFALEDFSRACLDGEPKQKNNGESWERFAGRKDLSLRELTILSYLCKWRDKEAEKLNRPMYKVVMDDVLITLSKNPPEQKVDLSAAGLSEKQIKLWGDAILSAIND